MTHLWQAELGEQLYEASVYYDDGDNPIAVEGPSTYTTSQHQAAAFARQALRGRVADRPGGFWYASIRRGRAIDPIGDGRPYDHDFAPDPDWSRTILAEETER
jgi:hypothetical protein